MKYSIAFGFAFALLLSVAVSASADEGTIGPVERMDTSATDIDEIMPSPTESVPFAGQGG